MIYVYTFYKVFKKWLTRDNLMGLTTSMHVVALKKEDYDLIVKIDLLI